MSSGKSSCARIVTGGGQRIYVKGEWFSRRCNLYITNGESAWVNKLSEAEISERAQDWGFESPQEYLQEVLLRFLCQQQESSTYDILPSRHGKMKLSWELQRETLTLTANFELEPASEPGAVTRSILDMLIDENVQLGDNLKRKSRAFEQMKAEADKCLVQSESFKNEKNALEADLYKKFVAVLNAKKAKLRELRDAVERAAPRQTPSQQQAASSASEQDTDEESGDEGSHGESGEGTRPVVDREERENPESTLISRSNGGMAYVHGTAQGGVEATERNGTSEEGPETMGPTSQLRSAGALRDEGIATASFSSQPRPQESQGPLAPGRLGTPGLYAKGSSVVVGNGSVGSQQANGVAAAERPSRPNAAAALLSGTGYTSAPRKRRL